MSRSYMPSVANAARCDSGRPDDFGSQVADPAFAADITPSPSKRVVEHGERLAGLDRSYYFSVIRRRGAKLRVDSDLTLERFGIVRSDDEPGESHVGKVFPEGVERGVGWVRGPTQGEGITARGRRREPGLGR